MFSKAGLVALLTASASFVSALPPTRTKIEQPACLSAVLASPNPLSTESPCDDTKDMQVRLRATCSADDLATAMHVFNIGCAAGKPVKPRSIIPSDQPDESGVSDVLGDTINQSLGDDPMATSEDKSDNGSHDESNSDLGKNLGKVLGSASGDSSTGDSGDNLAASLGDGLNKTLVGATNEDSGNTSGSDPVTDLGKGLGNDLDKTLGDTLSHTSGDTLGETLSDGLDAALAPVKSLPVVDEIVPTTTTAHDHTMSALTYHTSTLATSTNTLLSGHAVPTTARSHWGATWAVAGTGTGAPMATGTGGPFHHGNNGTVAKPTLATTVIMSGGGVTTVTAPAATSVGAGSNNNVQATGAAVAFAAGLALLL